MNVSDENNESRAPEVPNDSARPHPKHIVNIQMPSTSQQFKFAGAQQPAVTEVAPAVVPSSSTVTMVKATSKTQQQQQQHQQQPIAISFRQAQQHQHHLYSSPPPQYSHLGSQQQQQHQQQQQLHNDATAAAVNSQSNSPTAMTNGLGVGSGAHFDRPEQILAMMRSYKLRRLQNALSKSHRQVSSELNVPFSLSIMPRASAAGQSITPANQHHPHQNKTNNLFARGLTFSQDLKSPLRLVQSNSNVSKLPKLPFIYQQPQIVMEGSSNINGSVNVNNNSMSAANPETTQTVATADVLGSLIKPGDPHNQKRDLSKQINSQLAKSTISKNVIFNANTKLTNDNHNNNFNIKNNAVNTNNNNNKENSNAVRRFMGMPIGHRQKTDLPFSNAKHNEMDKRRGDATSPDNASGNENAKGKKLRNSQRDETIWPEIKNIETLSGHEKTALWLKQL